MELTASTLAPFKDLIKLRCGLHFDESAERPLIASLLKRIAATGAEDGKAYLKKLLRDEGEFHLLVELLTINETYFYRDPQQIKFFVDTLVPQLLVKRPEKSCVRIFSAGCASGEELVSIVMALREKYGAGFEKMFHFEGGDIDHAALRKANAGKYKEFSFRSLDVALRKRYFVEKPHGTWELGESIRQLVRFRYFNLLADVAPSGASLFDCIFFRNVSIYFDVATRKQALKHLHALMPVDGLLILGSAETMANDLGVFELKSQDGQFYFTKESEVLLQTGSKTLHRSANQKSAHPVQSSSLKLSKVFAVDTAAGDKNTGEIVETLSLKSRIEVHGFDLNKCRELTTEKKFSEAKLMATSYLVHDDKNRDALLMSAFICLQLKEHDAVCRHAQKILEELPWSLDALILCGLVAKAANLKEQSELALQSFKKAVYSNQDCWPAHYYLAEQYRILHHFVLARRTYQTVLRILASSAAPSDGLTIPLCLPMSEVRFLCKYQIQKIDEELPSPKGGA